MFRFECVGVQVPWMVIQPLDGYGLQTEKLMQGDGQELAIGPAWVGGKNQVNVLKSGAFFCSGFYPLYWGKSMHNYIILICNLQSNKAK